MLAVAAAVKISVEFTLGDGSVSSNYTFESSDFGLIDNETESPVAITLGMIENEHMLELLKRLWAGDAFEDVEDIDADQFARFIRASSYLMLQGDMSLRFARNMARKGLLGRHSGDIFRNFPLRSPDDWRGLSWQVFVAFAEETGCKVMVSGTQEVTLCSPDDSSAESYGTLAPVSGSERPAIKKLSMRCETLGKAESAPDRMMLLVWFLWHLAAPSLSVGSEFKLEAEDVQHFAKAISYVKELEEKKVIDAGLDLVTLNLSEHSRLCFRPLAGLISGLPSLEELWIHVAELGPLDADIFKSCKELKRLYLFGDEQSSSFVEKLIPNLSSLRELKINAECLKPKAANAFVRCDKLEKLHVNEEQGSRQSSGFVEALIPHLPSLIELKINVGNLTEKAASAFKGCPRVEMLHFDGGWQNASFVEALISSLPSLRKLQIRVELLSPKTANAFKGHDKLEKVVIFGPSQSSEFIEVFVSNLSSLRELEISIGCLSLRTADAFKGSGRLERLSLIGSEQELPFIEALLPHLPSLKKLAIEVGELSPQAANIFKQRKGLEELDLSGRFVSGFLKHILGLPLIDSLKVLNIWQFRGSEDLSSEDNQAMEAAQERAIQIDI